MTRQNRGMPWGEVVADPARGLFMGNRGCLHDEAGRIVRGFAGRRWIICRTEFRGRRRALMQPGRYTELFFLDEATALAAGHRPCAECRRAEYDRFRDAWARAFGGAPPSAEAMDRVLHAGRLDPRPRAPVAATELPEGTMARDERGVCGLVLAGEWRRFAPDGYGRPQPVPATLAPLTPAPTRAVLAAGYRPVLHPSATD